MLPHKSGIPLIIQQVKALLKKNLWIAMRSKRSSLLQLVAPFIFLFFLFVVDKSQRISSSLPEMRDPPVMIAPSIPECGTKFYIRRPCYDFVWSGNNSRYANEIVSRIMANNPGRPIPSFKVRSFRTPAEVDAWLFTNPLRCPGALHFVEKSANVMSYGLQTNYTSATKRDKSENPTLKFIVPLQIAAEREIARSLLADQNFSWTVGLKEFPHPAATFEDRSSSGFEVLAPLFLFTVAMFPFIFEMNSIVLEKELKLRQITAQAIDPSKKSNILYLLPPTLLAHALQVLINVTESHDTRGSSWSTRAKCPTDQSRCFLTMSLKAVIFAQNDVYVRFVYTFFWWLLIALYLDNVMPSPNGTRKSLLYFLNPRYWTGVGVNKPQGGKCGCCNSDDALDSATPDDMDVLEEENAVKQQMRSGETDPNIAVQICGLVKTYPGKLNCGCCCKCHKTDSFHAIKGLYVNLARDQLFCLLGPNGAGKTTTINCLTGITSVTAGDAIIYGNSIRNSIGMSNTRKLLGVCPQFDVLWCVLTGEEHLQLFARIKGLPPSSIKEVVKKSLEEVRLTASAKVRTGSYSGGMRRRLSVASALLGDPKLVILDEPTTGMDPISRRHVLDIIENAKRGRVIILTTHSMEEADILGDRIGIMAKGRLRCIGSSIRLKSRSGTGFIANLSFINGSASANSAHKETLKMFFRHHLGVSPKDESNAFLTFVVPRQKERLLKGILGELQDKQREFGIADIQLGLTTLEEVFLNIARQAELESAAADGRMETLTLTSGTQVPVGARYVAIPGSETAENPRGIMVEVHWEQNDSGALCISGHSNETVVPPNVQPSLPAAHPRSMGRAKGVVGRVIDPRQLSETSFDS
ncbi:ABC transporter A family member 2 [Bienertia sinuspersici]